MGRGDKKTAKGKRTMGSYGNTRKRKEDAKPIVVAKVKKVAKPAEVKAEKPAKPAKAEKPAKKAVAKKTEK
jgi:ribosomal small subunit protein bTHX